MQSVHGRNDRKLVLLNNNNQPVGPTKDVVVELSSFLGTLVRNATLCPLEILDWRYMDTKDDLWTYTQEKYAITDDAKEWALEVIGSAWRRHKFDLKKLCYKPCTSHEVLMAKRPPYVPECQLKELLKYWDSDKHKKMSETNTKNRKKLKNPHTAGKISFALVRNNLEKKKETFVSLKELFVVTRTRHPERLYKDTNEDTISKIAEMEEIEKQQSVDGSESVDAFSSVMGPEHPGRLRLYGRGVTKSSLKRKAGNSEPVSTATNDAVQVEERIHKMEEQMEEQKRTIQQDVTANIIAQLQRAGLINADVLAALCVHSPGKANFGPRANQLISRPSTSSNNRGSSEGEQRDENNEGTP
ncbi:hypothetical protein KY285_000602 [Solanum tuberosum]|nr:hypothetical protein KY285_000602 [Solanum tuberosum]